MTYDEVPELHFITPVANLASILEHGVLSNHAAKRLTPDAASIAMPGVQDRRERKTVPGGRPLHAYANLYFHARNPMMYARQEEHERVCVLSVRREVLTCSGVVVTDRNAAADLPRFYPSPDGLSQLDRSLIYAQSWTHPGDKKAYLRHKAIKCAEVLVPDRVRPEAVRGVYVSCQAAHDRVVTLVPSGLRVKISPDLFFQA